MRELCFREQLQNPAMIPGQGLQDSLHTARLSQGAFPHDLSCGGDGEKVPRQVHC